MATAPLVADQATISGMVIAFGNCQAECRGIETSVEAARGSLGTSWQSDQAAPNFIRATDEWLTGFHKVRQGLDMLNGNMETYSQLTTTTEDDNALNAGGWATP
jgi:hypothetical protein